MARPTANRLFVDVDRAPETRNGVFIPENARREPNTGTVLAVGRDVSGVREGDRVLLSKWAGVPATIDGRDVLVVTLDDVQGVIDA